MAPCSSRRPPSRARWRGSSAITAPMWKRPAPSPLPALLPRAGFRVVELARVAWPSLVRDVVNRLTAGRYRQFLARRWVSRAVWLAGVPPSLLLAYVGL